MKALHIAIIGLGLCVTSSSFAYSVVRTISCDCPYNPTNNGGYTILETSGTYQGNYRLTTKLKELGLGSYKACARNWSKNGSSSSAATHVKKGSFTTENVVNTQYDYYLPCTAKYYVQGYGTQEFSGWGMKAKVSKSYWNAGCKKTSSTAFTCYRK